MKSCAPIGNRRKRLEAGHTLNAVGISVAGHPRSRSLNPAQFCSRQFNARCARILLQTMEPLVVARLPDKSTKT
jgi:hypothetical protein